jgi:hypothetical protein
VIANHVLLASIQLIHCNPVVWSVVLECSKTMPHSSNVPIARKADSMNKRALTVLQVAWNVPWGNINRRQLQWRVLIAPVVKQMEKPPAHPTRCASIAYRASIPTIKQGSINVWIVQREHIATIQDKPHVSVVNEANGRKP